MEYELVEAIEKFIVAVIKDEERGSDTVDALNRINTKDALHAAILKLKKSNT